MNGNTLKIFACICMLFDHIGAILFPEIMFLRAIGRLSLPIFAFFIAEGCKYTHDKAHYLIFMALMGVAMMIVEFAFTGQYVGNIFVLFSLSIILIYTFQKLKAVIFSSEFKLNQQIFWLIAFGTSVAFCWVSCEILAVDYGFCGVMLAFFVNIPNLRGMVGGKAERLDNLISRLVCLGIALVVLAIDLGGLQYLSLLALIPLATYNGQRGKRPLKYFFYIFYPAHIVVLTAISMIF